MLALSALCWLAAASSVFQTAAAGKLSDDIDAVRSRRKADLAGAVAPATLALVPSWLSTQASDGSWSTVDYRAGCDAPRSSWPAQEHWARIVALASAWSGLHPASALAGDAKVLASASNAMNFWFERDFTRSSCMDQGGTAGGSCPCGTSGLWNPNWYANAILIPSLVSSSCLLLDAALTSAQRAACVAIPSRAVSRKDSTIKQLGKFTSANMVNLMEIGVSLGLLTNNSSMVVDSFKTAFAAVSIATEPGQDGIHGDGSYLFHQGVLYNGNYGKDLINSLINLIGEASKTTSLAASASVQHAFATLVQGSEWMVITDPQTKRERWEVGTLGRFIASPSVDLRASADVNFNVTKLAAATTDFSGEDDLSSVATRLASNGTATSVNSGSLIGSRAFPASDYMILRRGSYIQSWKSVSTRTRSTESINGVNLQGSRLGLGSLYTYTTGDDYFDIQASADPDLVPGSVTLLRTSSTSSGEIGATGKTSFVGSASDGYSGVGAEDFVDPYDGSLQYRKATFFGETSTLVSISSISTASSAPVAVVLDNRRLAPDQTLLVDGRAASSGAFNASSLQHGSTTYLLPSSSRLTISASDRTGNWTTISSPSTLISTVPIFSAYATLPSSSSSFSYSIQPSRSSNSPPTLRALAVGPRDVTAAYETSGSGVVFLVFWSSKQTVSFPLALLGSSASGNLTLTSHSPSIAILAPSLSPSSSPRLNITFSDPTQLLSTLAFDLSTASGSSVTLSCLKGVEGCSSASSKSVAVSQSLSSAGSPGMAVQVQVAIDMPVATAASGSATGSAGGGGGGQSSSPGGSSQAATSSARRRHRRPWFSI